MRRATAVVAALVILATAVPAISQTVISASDPSFSWTGKQGQQANYRWSATVNNPSRRDAVVHVSMQLLDATGNVVGNSTETVTVGKMSEAAVSGQGSLAFSDASNATQYRVLVEGAES